MKKLVAHFLLLALFITSIQVVAQQRLSFKRQQTAITFAEAQLPQALERRAADILERQCFESEGDWQDARLTGEVTPLYRPDMDEPAFYEFKVAPQGFMILATGEHDFPLTMMSQAGERSISEKLTEQADGREIGKIFYLDALAFAAESPDGELIATVGDQPQRLIRNEPGSVMMPESVESFLVAGGGDDEMPAEVVTEEGPLVEVPYEIVAWDSWQQLKDNYRETYAELLEQKREAAAYDWETENLAVDFGEGIPLGSTFLVPLLSDEADFHVEGEGAQFAEVTRLQRAGLADVIAIQPFEAVAGADLTLQLFYADREPETQTFFFVNSGSGKNHWRTILDFRAGSSADQRMYGQFLTNGCWSGCGATAWAMLLGWADHQAAQGNPAWSHRWGIYRENGGFGRDVGAPRHQDRGVENMTGEIAQHVGSFCVGGPTATLPTSMHFVSQYLRHRTGATERSTYYAFFNGIADAINSMTRNNTPVVIGTGFYSHYPLAWGSQVRRRIVRKCFLWHCWDERQYEEKVLINNGHFSYGDYYKLYLNTNTFFVGQLKAN